MRLPNADRCRRCALVRPEIPQASAADLDECYRRAAQAQKEWVARLPGERAEVMRRAGRIMEQRRHEIITWLIREAGSTRIKGSLEWETVHSVLRESESLPYLVERRLLPGDIPGKECRGYRQPVGVVGIISPWNWPMQLTARSLFPALAIGNTGWPLRAASKPA